MARRSKPGKRPTARPRRRYARRSAPRPNGGKVTALKTATVPDRMVLRMKYVDNIVLSGVGGASRVFRLNSIYDPDTSITTGHQPLGYDQWNTFYAKYRVFKANVTIKATNASSNSADTEQIGMVAFNNNIPISTADDFYEQPHCKKSLLSGRGGMDRAIMTYSVDCPRIVGMAPVVYKSTSTTASLFGSNPLEQVNLAILTRPIDGQSTSLVNVEVSITYFVELFDRSSIPISYPAGKDPDLAGATDGTIGDLVPEGGN